MQSSNHKGAVAEAAIAYEATKLGIPVLRPLAEHGRYDLAFDLGDRILRVQCKWGALAKDAGVVSVRVGGSRHTPHGYVLSSYSPDEVDAVAVYCGDLNRSYLIPIEVAGGKKQLHLRLEPPRNGQRGAINMAEQYTFGAVAQLARATRWQRVGRGFESPQLHSRPAEETPGTAGSETVGAHMFRNHFGYYLERAAGGDEILITRRGKPYARLLPAAG